jgi:hypothetical protein
MEIEDQCAQDKVYLQQSRIHQKTEGSLKATKNFFWELQQKIVEINKQFEEM